MDCPTCGHPNPPEARYCGGCAASLLVSAPCPSCGVGNPAGQRFCNGCGRELRSPRLNVPDHLADKIRNVRITEGERKQVTVLFADVMGSMELAERQDPEAWRGIMERFVEILCEGVHRFDGTVDKFTGDGIMALFGAPIAHEDHPQRACYAALHLQRELDSYAAQLRREQGLSFSVRMGLNSGEVVVGAIGEDLGMTYTAIGHTVGLAQRMEQLAEPGTAYVTQDTAALVQGYLELSDLGEFQIKGASRPVTVHQLTGVGSARGRLDIARARGFSRFVGRDEELRILESALEEAIAGRPQVIGIVGEAGVGKSRLCDTFARRCRARGMPVYHTSGQAHATSVPLLPVLHIMRSYFDVTDLDSDQIARERIAGKLLLLDKSFADDLPVLFEFLGVPDPDHPSPRMDFEARQRRVLDLTKRLVHAQSARAPGVSVFEDLHWLDPGSEVFVANYLEAAQGGRGLTILNFRPDYHAAWMSKSYYRQIALAPLGPEAVDQLLADLLGADPSLDGLGELVRARTSGNPFFIEEVVLALAESGTLEGDRGAYRLAGPIDWAGVPASVQAILAARIDRLAEREKAVLQAAAVIGKEFSESILARVTELEPSSLAEALHELVEREFVLERELYPEAIYAFRHPLTQEVAYRTQLGERRATVHAAVARAVEALDPERLDERAALLAQHWESAGESLEAARWHARAGAWAGSKDPGASLDHWRRVRELSDSLPDGAEPRELGLAARLYALSYGWRLGISEREAATLFAEAEDMASRAQDHWSRTLLLSIYSTIMFGSLGRVDEAVTLTRQATALAEESGDPALYLSAATASYALFLRGEYREALGVCDRAIELADGDPGVGAGITNECPLAQCLLQKGGIMCDLGRLDEARELFDRGTRMVAERGATETLGWSHLWGAFHAYHCGEPDRAMAHAQQAVEIADRLGDGFSRTWSWVMVGLAATAQEDWQHVIGAIEHAQAISGERQAAADAEGLSLMLLGQAQLHLGDPERAVRLCRDAVALLRSRGQAMELLGNVVLAQVLLASSGVAAREEIEAVLMRADELLQANGTLVSEPAIHLQRAALARQSGDAGGQERELREAHRLFAQIGATGHAERLAEEVSAFSP